MSAVKKDKQKVLGESFDDERIKKFLDVQPPADVSADFHALEIAYRGMHEVNFATFVQFFVEAGRDINATNKDGNTILSLMKTHRHAGPYIEVLQKAF